MLGTSFNYVYEQRNLRFPPKLDCWLFQDGCQFAVSTDAGLTIHTDSGCADNRYCLNVPFIYQFQTFLLY